jgi:hypothetical protein
MQRLDAGGEGGTSCRGWKLGVLMQRLETGGKVMQRLETGDKVMQRLETGGKAMQML